jgi:hypothetical protein
MSQDGAGRDHYSHDLYLELSIFFAGQKELIVSNLEIDHNGNRVIVAR